VREVRNDVRHWEAIDDGARLLLFDQLAPPAEIEKLAEERETAIVLTCPWHRRDAEALANRYGAPLYVPPPDEGSGYPSRSSFSRTGRRRIERRSNVRSRCLPARTLRHKARGLQRSSRRS
jgi:hypothetical protein